VIVISYADYEDSELDGYVPRIVHVDRNNREIDEGLALIEASLSRADGPLRYPGE
jgi:aspartate 1-decarboxylase